ncbi:hypothetical protein EG328_009183 [Venturia inaequalis]|uniref:BTB domain-containing protein n=1 Tax=Venturia inaequalis TaxID=5025 RepID=A0A8H3YQ26_VENIN|nr:hypothetical protein EG328_009183 [Venturia inaequalis]
MNAVASVLTIWEIKITILGNFLRKYTINGRALCTFGRKMCRVLVGNDKEPYTIHQELIASSSHFFKGALRSNMMEKNGDVKLPTHKPSHFDIYYRWLYSGTLDDFNFKEPGTSFKLFELYFLGDMLLDERFRNQLIDKVVQAITAVAVVPLNNPDVNLVYKNTLKDDKLRQLMAHIWAYRAHPHPHCLLNQASSTKEQPRCKVRRANTSYVDQFAEEPVTIE